MKFSDLLGQPEPEETPTAPPVEQAGAAAEPDPITVFAPVPETPPDRPGPAPFEPDLDATVPEVSPNRPPPVPFEPDLDAAIPAAPPVPPVPPATEPTLDPVLDAPPPDPTLEVAAPGGRSDLASLNVHQPAPEPEPARSTVLDQLIGLDEVVDDLLPPRRSRR